MSVHHLSFQPQAVYQYVNSRHINDYPSKYTSFVTRMVQLSDYTQQSIKDKNQNSPYLFTRNSQRQSRRISAIHHMACLG